MYDQKKKELSDFLRPRGIVEEIILAGVCIVFAFISLCQPNITIGVFFVCLIIGIAVLLFALRTWMKHDQYMQAVEQSGNMMWILQDFAHAGSLARGELRFGQYYLYAKGHGTFLSYSEITKVYQFVHKTNFIEDMRQLKYVDREGKEKVLCRLKTRGKSDADVRMAVTLLYRKNPNIRIGYR